MRVRFISWGLVQVFVPGLKQVCPANNLAFGGIILVPSPSHKVGGGGGNTKHACVRGACQIYVSAIRHSPTLVSVFFPRAKGAFPVFLRYFRSLAGKIRLACETTFIYGLMDSVTVV